MAYVEITHTAYPLRPRRRYTAKHRLEVYDDLLSRVRRALHRYWARPLLLAPLHG